MILRCSNTASSVCPYRKYCGPDAIYMQGSECDRFNEAVERLVAASIAFDSPPLYGEEEVDE